MPKHHKKEPLPTVPATKPHPAVDSEVHLEETIEAIVNKHNYKLANPQSVVDQKTGVETSKKRVEITGYGGTATATLNREIKDVAVLGKVDEDGKVVTRGIIHDLIDTFGDQVRVEYKNRKVTLNEGENSRWLGILIVSHINN